MRRPSSSESVDENGRISSFGTQIQWISPRTEKEQQQNKHAFFPYMTSVVAVTMYLLYCYELRNAQVPAQCWYL